jgi:transposase
MAQRRISMKKIRDIIKLKTETDLSNRQIAKALSVSRPAVSEYWEQFQASGIDYKRLKGLPDSKLLELLKKEKKAKSRLTTLISYFPYFVNELTRVGVTLQLLWEEYKQKHPTGYKYSQFCYHFQVWKKHSEVRMHIVHKAGDKMFVDYTGDHMNITDPKTGELKPHEVFVAILGCSGLTYAEASPDQKKENWVRSNENALWYFGGVPRAIIPDNLKSAVTKTDPYEPGINLLFDDFAEHYGTVIMPARARKARDKALVENAVRLIYQRVFAPLRNSTFYSLDELNKAIRELVDEHNAKNLSRLSFSRRDRFNQSEQKVLHKLPAERYKLKSNHEATVQFNYHIELPCDRHYYSVPHFLRRKGKKIKVKVVYDERIVAIYHDNVRIVQHLRDKTPNGYTTLPEHMPPDHRFYADWSPKRILSWAKKYGEDVVKTVQSMLKSRKHPEQAFKVCLGLLNLPKKYNEKYFISACKKANELGISSLKKITEIVKQFDYDSKQPEFDFEGPIPLHKNIRGSEYYN